MDVSVVIVNWNTGELLRRCLDCLPAALTGLSTEVLVVDNASSDQSIAHAEGSRQAFRLLPMTSNLGFARANNIAIRQAKGDVIILLNPDTEPREGSLATLIDVLREHPSAAAVGPKLLNTDGSLQPSCRRFPTTLTFLFLFFKLHHILPGTKTLRSYFMRDVAHNVERPVDQIMGACMAIPRTALERIGLLDERYWIWFEEVDWCRRAAVAERQIWFTPRATVVHHGGVSFQQVLPVKKEWRFIRSSLRYARSYLGWSSVLMLSLAAPFALALDALAFARWLRRSQPVHPVSS